MIRENSRIKVHFYDWNNSGHREIKTDISDKIFTVYKKGGELGFDGNQKRSPYTSRGDKFTPFRSYAQSVYFENVNTGKIYRYDNIKGRLETVA